MDYSAKLSLSYYKTIATLNEAHNIYLVQHQETSKIYVKKILDVYNIDIYKTLAAHPLAGIPQIIEYFEIDAQLIVIESFISGQSLEEKISNTALDLSLIIHYISELCNILSALHTYQPPIIHRDIKPSNIIITEHNHVVLIDFNAAKYFSDTANNDTILLGTKGYAAPEQYGFGSSTPKTDIYAIGVLLKELTSALSNVPPAITDIIDTCMKLNPSDRYETVDDLADTLNKAIHPSAKKKEVSLSFKSFLPPGYRTGTIWKMFLATPVYLLLFWLSKTLTVENTYGLALLVERFFCFLVFLSIIFGTFNYMDIQRHFPLCNHKYLIVRIAGIIILDILMAVSLITLMLLIESLFL